MTPVTAHIAVDGLVFLIEGEVSIEPDGALASRIVSVVLEVAEGFDKEYEDDDLDDFERHYAQRAHDALTAAFLAAKAA